MGGVKNNSWGHWFATVRFSFIHSPYSLSRPQYRHQRQLGRLTWDGRRRWTWWGHWLSPVIAAPTRPALKRRCRNVPAPRSPSAETVSAETVAPKCQVPFVPAADLPGRQTLCSGGTSRLTVPSVRHSTVGSATWPIPDWLIDSSHCSTFWQQQRAHSTVQTSRDCVTKNATFLSRDFQQRFAVPEVSIATLVRDFTILSTAVIIHKINVTRSQ